MNFLPRLASLIDELPPEVIDSLDAETLRKVRDGLIDKLPEDVVDRLPDSVADKIPAGLIDFASENPAAAIVFAVIGVLAVVIFFWGIFKSAFKAALFAGIVGAAAWYFFFQL